ncbi:cathepsin B-like [Ostrinia nubilalis]|uniref:cathepsin B-like n=1 Tax=Ostrinia nubilalis TaxID=29057 RepID=UPI0030823774
MSTFFVIITVMFIINSPIGATKHMHPLSDEFIQHINSKQNLWRAGRNFHEKIPMSYIKRLMGSRRDYGWNRLPQRTYGMDFDRLPEQFDARLKWNRCPTLYDIRDQGSCGSCWAVSAVSAMTDRTCIRSNGTRNFYFSVEDVLSCCHNCGPGCGGGVLWKAWMYSKRQGVVSGGGYGSQQGCLPYQIEPCDHDIPGPRPECGMYVNTPKCQKNCQPKYKITYKKDKKIFKSIYNLKSNTAIKKDIFKNGPVTATFDVYSDFLSYKDGIYYHVAGDKVGRHSVKLLGWGVDNGIKYWLVANSWNTDWGENGFFKIRRGKNDCGIEEVAVAGV